MHPVTVTPFMFCGPPYSYIAVNHLSQSLHGRSLILFPFHFFSSLLFCRRERFHDSLACEAKTPIELFTFSRFYQKIEKDMLFKLCSTQVHNHPRPTCASGTLLKVRAFFVLTLLFHLNFCAVHNKPGYCGAHLSSKP
jgi:hypothetical protein